MFAQTKRVHVHRNMHPSLSRWLEVCALSRALSPVLSPVRSRLCSITQTAMMPPVVGERRPKGGPGKVPGCTVPSNSSGQWAYLPPDYVLANSALQLDTDDCHCHKRPCRRAVGKMPAVQSRGRTGKRVRVDDPTVSVGLKAADEQLRPPILVSVDEIWAMRLGAACSSPYLLFTPLPRH